VVASTAHHQTARRLRRDLTPAERLLRRAIRANALGAKFCRHHPIGPYVADFACLEAALVIEVDGGQHGDDRDAERDAFMRAAGWEILRFSNNEVLDKLDGVIAVIAQSVAARAGAPHPARFVRPSPRPSPVQRERE
jgi:very-short-patch-repair endonuclease